MEKFDVIVVGAGLAGLAAAFTLAERGVEVLVLERGDYPGAKNVSGGRLYLNPVRGLFPGLFDQAPLERFIVHEGLALFARNRSITVDYVGGEFRREPHQSWSVLRSKFDRWLAEQVEAKGAMLMSKVRVDGLIRNKGRVSGVVAAGDELLADVVIACDGAVSLLSEKAGLRSTVHTKDFALGIKEVIKLDSAAINERFNLEGNEGTARLYAGEVTHGRFGGGFLYTNLESVSLGIVVGIEDLLKDETLEAPALLDDFKKRPEVAPLIRGGETLEYSAHLIPEGGFKSLSRLYGDGILAAGDAAGFALNTGFTVRGMEYALATGRMAALAVLKAKESGDFGADRLAVYRDLLEQSFVWKDFRNFQEAPRVIANPRFFAHYPEWVGEIFRDLYAVTDGPKERLYPTIRKHLTLGEIWSLFKDLKEVMKI